jgi:hypothetical protein
MFVTVWMLLRKLTVFASGRQSHIEVWSSWQEKRWWLRVSEFLSCFFCIIFENNSVVLVGYWGWSPSLQLYWFKFVFQGRNRNTNLHVFFWTDMFFRIKSILFRLLPWLETRYEIFLYWDGISLVCLNWFYACDVLLFFNEYIMTYVKI